MLSTPGLAYKAYLKKTKTELLTEKRRGIRGGICHTFYQYATANNNEKLHKKLSSKQRILISSILGHKQSI